MKYSGHRKLLSELSKLSAFILLGYYTDTIASNLFLQLPPRENWFQYVRSEYAQQLTFLALSVYVSSIFDRYTYICSIYVQIYTYIYIQYICTPVHIYKYYLCTGVHVYILSMYRCTCMKRTRTADWRSWWTMLNYPLILPQNLFLRLNTSLLVWVQQFYINFSFCFIKLLNCV